MRKKVCRKCKIFVEGDTCPVCRESQFSQNWQGRVYVLDAKSSVVAQKAGMGVKGEYAIKVR